MSEGEELAVAEAGKLGLFKAIAGFFRKALKLGAEDAGKDAEQNLQKDLAQDLQKKLDTTPLKGYVGENLPGNRFWKGKVVKYLTEEERADLQLFVKDGKLYDASGNLFDTSAASSLHPGGQGRAIFVMDENGHLYASNQQIWGQFHHSSFLAGAPVAGAGELQVSDGVLESVTDHSGHYQPSRAFTQQVLNTLESQGIDISNVGIDLWAPF
jgi:hypothetical protein